MHVVGVDLLPCEPLPGCHFMRGDFTEAAVQSSLLELLGGRSVEMVLSDMSPNRSGNNSLDEARLIDLIDKSLLFSRQVLRPGGSFVAKALQGAELQPLLQRTRRFFGAAALVKPAASRDQSSEVYLVAKRFDPEAFDAHGHV